MRAIVCRTTDGEAIDVKTIFALINPRGSCDCGTLSFACIQKRICIILVECMGIDIRNIVPVLKYWYIDGSVRVL